MIYFTLLSGIMQDVIGAVYRPGEWKVGLKKTSFSLSNLFFGVVFFGLVTLRYVSSISGSGCGPS